MNLRYLGVALVAGTVGAMVALLVAPASGRDTRRKLARRLEREKEELVREGRRALDDVGEYLEEQVKHAKKNVDEAVDELTDYVQDQLHQGKKKLAKIVPV
jgi:gas vesicle protein